MNNTFAQDNSDRISAKGFAVFEEKGHFQPYTFSRHAVGDNDIQIEILYAGICHSDLHHVFADWGRRSIPGFPDTKSRDVRLPSVRTSGNSS